MHDNHLFTGGLRSIDMTKGELLHVLEPFSDDIRIVVVAPNGCQQPIKSAIYDYADHHEEAVITLVIGNRDK